MPTEILVGQKVVVDVENTDAKWSAKALAVCWSLSRLRYRQLL